MMNHLRSFPSSILLLILIASVGCNGDNPTDAQTTELNFDSGEFAIFGVQDVMDAFQGASLEKGMAFDPNLVGGNFFGDGGRFGRRGPRGPLGPRMQRRRSGNHLREILPELGLSEEQRAQIREAMAAHRDCIQEPLQAFLDANREILDAANLERQAIIDSARSESLSREEARQRLEDLNESTRETILNNPDSQAAAQAICECKVTLFDTVRALLDENQQAAWDEWVSGLEDACFHAS